VHVCVHMGVCVCVCARACACVRARVRACARVCVRARACERERERDFLITVDLFAKTYLLLQEGKVYKIAACVLHCSTSSLLL